MFRKIWKIHSNRQIEWKLLYECRNTQYYLYEEILVWHYNLLIQHAGPENFIPTSRFSHWQKWYFTCTVSNEIVNKKYFEKSKFCYAVWTRKKKQLCLNWPNGKRKWKSLLNLLLLLLVSLMLLLDFYIGYALMLHNPSFQ